ncbi:zinc/manganese transport system substrate-binding protein [Neisseria sp. HSC-16F19]|nr:zinc/manganese transport system substrate-binding protein [Neisseria sp. HSC-16F19]
MMKMKWQLGLAAFLCSGSLWAAPLQVVTSFSILGDVTQQIGGERVAVQNLVGPDQDAHVYQLKASDIQKIRGAKLVLLNGLGFEKADVERAAKQAKVPVAVATRGITPIKMEEGGHHHHDHGHGHGHHEHGEFDPHVWHDPVLMQTYAQNVADALVKADPAGKAHYQQRLNSYKNELAQLNTWAAQSFNSVPVAQRKVITGHEGFGYMAKRYKVYFAAPQGVNAESEPSARQVAAIIRQIKQQGIKAVFSENIKDTRMINRIAQETGVKVQGRLYSDALSKGAPANSYTGLFRYNVNALVKAMK